MIDIEAEVKEIVISILTEDTNLPIAVENLNMDEPLVNLGLHSISYIKLIIELEKKFNFEMDVDNLNINDNKSITMRDLLSIIQKRKTGDDNE